MNKSAISAPLNWPEENKNLDCIEFIDTISGPKIKFNFGLHAMKLYSVPRLCTNNKNIDLPIQNYVANKCNKYYYILSCWLTWFHNMHFMKVATKTYSLKRCKTEPNLYYGITGTNQSHWSAMIVICKLAEKNWPLSINWV